MKTIGERIVYLREKYDISQKTLATDINITEASLSRYENNLREPKAEIIAKIAIRFDATTDFLLGVSNQINDKHSIQEFEFLNNVNALSNESKEELIRYIDLLKLRDSTKRNQHKKSSALKKPNY